MEVETALPSFWLRSIVGLLIVFNALDGVFTIYWVDSGRMTEANPLMGLLIGSHPLLFICVKLLLVFLGTWLLWNLRQIPAAVVSIFLCFAVYLSVLIYHLDIMHRVLFAGPVG